MPFEDDVKKYIARGSLCELWGRPVANMTREQLIGFIGFLDELVELERKGKGPRAVAQAKA